MQVCRCVQMAGIIMACKASALHDKQLGRIAEQCATSCLPIPKEHGKSGWGTKWQKQLREVWETWLQLHRCTGNRPFHAQSCF